MTVGPAVTLPVRWQLYKKSEDPWLAQRRGLRVDTDENLKQVGGEGGGYDATALAF